ncbi:hypothetical protein PLICRDRAFT_55610 [Plicaturopsis crispa FD-325 SS-3]|nr:hypothetical protein PLICRDRAFT_55610 [Plicaturopsis crispa FD-325 SS-3]
MHDKGFRRTDAGSGNHVRTGDEKKTNDAPHEPATTPRSTFQAICLVMTCTFAMIVNQANNTSVSIALPTIQRDLQIDEAKLQWLVSAYSLSSGCLLLFFGRIADLYGRKKVFLTGSVCLAAFTLGCGFAQDEITLDVLRGLQGIGAAATIPASLGILAHAFPPSRARSAAFATFAAGAPLGGAVGIVLGAVLTQLSKATWRSPFYLSTGLTILCFIGGIVSIPPDLPLPAEIDRRVDWIGAALITIGLVLIVFVLSDGEVAPNGWATSYIIALLVIGVAFVALFLAWQRYLEGVQANPNTTRSRWTPPPLMKVSIWKRSRGRFAVVQWIAFLNWMTFLSWAFWVQLYYQDYAHFSPVLTMVRLLPMMVTGVLCNIVVAMVVGHVPLVFLMCTGTLLTGCAPLLFAVIKPNAPYWSFGFPSAILSVFGADFVYATGTIFIAKIVDPDEQSVAGGLFQTMTQLGTSLGLTITTIVFNRVVKRETLAEGQSPVGVSGVDAPREAQLLGYRDAQWTAFAFGMFATLLGVVFLRKVGIVGHRDTKDDRADSQEETVTADAKPNRTLEAA